MLGCVEERERERERASTDTEAAAAGAHRLDSLLTRKESLRADLGKFQVLLFACLLACLLVCERERERERERVPTLRQRLPASTDKHIDSQDEALLADDSDQAHFHEACYAEHRRLTQEWPALKAALERPPSGSPVDALNRIRERLAQAQRSFPELGFPALVQQHLDEELVAAGQAALQSMVDERIEATVPAFR